MPRSLVSLVQRFTQAWHRAAAGEPVQETHVTFLKVQTMLDTLSPRRLDLLRHVRQHGASNTRELALALGRDYKHVYQDVAGEWRPASSSIPAEADRAGRLRESSP